MTVSSTTNKVSYSGNGVTVTFPYTFKIFADGDLTVTLRSSAGVETTKALTTHFTVTGAGDEAGGNVVMLTAPATGETLVIKRELDLTQETDYVDNDPFPAESHEEALDRLTMIEQQQQEIIDRAFTYPVSYAGSASKEMPEPSASKVLAWKSDASALENVSGMSTELYTVTALMTSILAMSTASEVLTGLGLSAFIKTLIDDADAATARATLGTEKEMIYNLKPVVNVAVNKLDLFSKSGGVVPDATNPIKVMIPDGNGYTQRSRAAAYLSGTSQFILADAGNYWSKGSLDAEIKTAYVYAIWDGTGVVWALAGYSGFHMVPTTTTVTDDDYFLLEASSTYTRSAAHYCVCVGRIRYQYDTGDTPDHTIQATVENSPRVNWNPPSDYGYKKNLATSVTAEADISDVAIVAVVVKQAGKYKIDGIVSAYGEGTTNVLTVRIKTGSATYGSATLRATNNNNDASAGAQLVLTVIDEVYLNNGDSIHLGAALTSSATTRTIYGDGDGVSTGIIFKRAD